MCFSASTSPSTRVNVYVFWAEMESVKRPRLRSIMGLVPVRDGRITYDGRNLAGLPPHEIARSGIGYAPDERLIFPDLTVRDNLEIAIKPPLSSETTPWTLERIYDAIPHFKTA